MSSVKVNTKESKSLHHVCMRGLTTPGAGGGEGVTESFIWICCVYNPPACLQTCSLSKVKTTQQQQQQQQQAAFQIFHGTGKASGSLVPRVGECQSVPHIHRFPKEHILTIAIILYLSQAPIQQSSKWKTIPDCPSLKPPPPRLGDPGKRIKQPDRV